MFHCREVSIFTVSLDPPKRCGQLALTITTPGHEAALAVPPRREKETRKRDSSTPNLAILGLTVGVRGTVGLKNYCMVVENHRAGTKPMLWAFGQVGSVLSHAMSYAGVSMSWFGVPCPDCPFRVTTCHD